jgi:hypothetical protein
MRLRGGSVNAMAARNDDIAVLIGNGLSIAYDPDLAMKPLTDVIIERFNDAAGDGTDAAHILGGLATDLDERNPSEDFEALLGPLDRITDLLTRVESLTRLVQQLPVGTVTGAIDTVRDFLKEVQRLGVGHALEAIDDRAHAEHERLTTVREFIEAIIAASRTATVTIGNLNYDSLVLSSLLTIDPSNLCDMAAGNRRDDRVIVDGYLPVSCRPIREKANFPSRQCLLLHLHGSVSWLREPGGAVFRFPMGDIRMSSYWENFRAGRTAWSPVVVLTNQKVKSELVATWPFSLAYTTFHERLLTADRWLIAGYGFRDECVNDALARAWRAREREPAVLVITHGRTPTNDAILRGIGWSKDLDEEQRPVQRWLHVDRGGIEQATKSPCWQAWCGR